VIIRKPAAGHDLRPRPHRARRFPPRIRPRRPALSGQANRSRDHMWSFETDNREPARVIPRSADLRHHRPHRRAAAKYAFKCAPAVLASCRRRAGNYDL